MKNLAFGALLVGLLVACGGGDKKNVIVIDTNGPDAPMQCNPLTQAGCMAGEKCTWLLDALMPQYVGHIGCAPDGTGNVGEPRKILNGCHPRIADQRIADHHRIEPGAQPLCVANERRCPALDAAWTSLERLS